MFFVFVGTVLTSLNNIKQTVLSFGHLAFGSSMLSDMDYSTIHVSCSLEHEVLHDPLELPVAAAPLGVGCLEATLGLLQGIRCEEQNRCIPGDRAFGEAHS